LPETGPARPGMSVTDVPAKQVIKFHQFLLREAQSVPKGAFNHRTGWKIMDPSKGGNRHPAAGSLCPPCRSESPLRMYPTPAAPEPGAPPSPASGAGCQSERCAMTVGLGRHRFRTCAPVSEFLWP
jgi:hypothetical protein